VPHLSTRPSHPSKPRSRNDETLETAWPGYVRALAMVLAATALNGCSEKASEAPSGNIRPVLTLVAEPTSQTPAAEYAGSVRSHFETPLAFRTTGQITARQVEVGDRVSTGQVLMRLDPGDAELGATSARAQASAAEVNAAAVTQDLVRARRLLAEGFISQSEFDRQNATAAQAAAQLSSSRAQSQAAIRQVGYAILKSPRAGVVAGLTAEVGATVGAGQTVATVADPNHLEIAISVPEDQRAFLTASPKITVGIWANDKVRYPGHVQTLSEVANTQTRTFDARIAIDAPAGEVKLGQTAEVYVDHPPGPPQFRVPLTAIDQRGGVARVWIYDGKTSKANPRAVVVSTADKAYALISSGLGTGERVIVSGVHILHPGQAVRLMSSTVGTQP
jgi:membrane fusion protein, multidrug efflux system